MNNRRLVPLVIYLAALVLVFSWVSGMSASSKSELPYSVLVGLFEK